MSEWHIQTKVLIVSAVISCMRIMKVEFLMPNRTIATGSSCAYSLVRFVLLPPLIPRMFDPSSGTSGETTPFLLHSCIPFVNESHYLHLLPGLTALQEIWNMDPHITVEASKFEAAVPFRATTAHLH